jgi:hypothetical protein
MHHLSLEARQIAEFIKSKGILGEINAEFYYCHASLCLLDTIYSVQSKYYPTVKNTIQRYASFYKLFPVIDRPNRITAKEDTIQDLANHIKEVGTDGFAVEILKNRTKISDRLKSEIVLDLSIYFLEKGICTLKHLSVWARDVKPDLFKNESRIYGIGPVVIRYLAMLAGNDSFIKPDTHILRFLSNILNRPISDPKEAEGILKETAEMLHVTAREVDNSIWRYQSSKG